MKFNISKEKMLEGIHIMNSFGTRLTGSKGHNGFIKWLKDEIGKMDIPVYSDPFYFRRWEEKKSSIEIINGEEKINIPVSSAYPYSGETSTWNKSPSTNIKRKRERGKKKAPGLH